MSNSTEHRPTKPGVPCSTQGGCAADVGTTDSALVSESAAAPQTELSRALQGHLVRVGLSPATATRLDGRVQALAGAACDAMAAGEDPDTAMAAVMAQMRAEVAAALRGDA